MAITRKKPPAKFREILLDELGAEFAGRAAEFGVQAIPRTYFDDIIKYVPESILKVDDVQDAVARVPRALGRVLGWKEGLAEVLGTATKEALEEVGKRANEIPTDSGEQRIFARRVVNNLRAYERLNDIKGGESMRKKPQPKSFWDRLTECSPVLITQFRATFDEAFPRDIANPNGPGQIVNPERAHIMDELGRIATTKERVLLVISSRDWQELREYLEHLIKESKKLPEADRSLLAHALHRLGVAQMSEEVVRVKEDIANKLRGVAARLGSKAKSLRDAGF